MDVIERIHQVVKPEAEEAQLNTKHFYGVLETGNEVHRAPPYLVEDLTNKEPTAEEITAIAKLIDIDEGLKLPSEERLFVIKYNGVKIAGYKGRTTFKTVGGAKISLMSSFALKKP